MLNIYVCESIYINLLITINIYYIHITLLPWSLSLLSRGGVSR